MVPERADSLALLTLSLTGLVFLQFGAFRFSKQIS
jgi:hypothetical protein